jgi:hypothetical protein
MSVERRIGLGFPCTHCCATGTEPYTGLDAGQRRTKCTKGCDDGFVKFTGFHADKDLPIKPGDRVRIRKGTVIKTICRGTRLAGRTYTVKVDHVLNGANEYYYREKIPAQNPKVCWPGPGGYWSEADINDVEKIQEDA